MSFCHLTEYQLEHYANIIVNFPATKSIFPSIRSCWFDLLHWLNTPEIPMIFFIKINHINVTYKLRVHCFFMSVIQNSLITHWSFHFKGNRLCTKLSSVYMFMCLPLIELTVPFTCTMIGISPFIGYWLSLLWSRLQDIEALSLIIFITWLHTYGLLWM